MFPLEKECEEFQHLWVFIQHVPDRDHLISDQSAWHALHLTS